VFLWFFKLKKDSRVVNKSEVVWVCIGDEIDWVDSVEDVPEGCRQVTEIDACMYFCFNAIVDKINYARCHAPYGVTLLEGTIVEQMQRVAKEMTEKGEWQDEVWRMG
jgi:hypothetical protein